MTNSLLSGDNPGIEEPEDGNFLAALVGEGKTYANEQELAKGKLHADKHIKDLEATLEGLRSDLKERVTIEDYMRELQKERSETQEGTTNTSPKPENPMNADEIAAEVERRLQEKERSKRSEENLSKVKTELSKLYGHSYENHIRNTANTLGMSLAEMDDLAKRSPTAFMNLMGKPSGGSNFTPPSGNASVDTTIGDASVRNETYYKKMKEADPVKYWDKKTQMKMHEDAQEQGFDFFTESR
ncbi:MAG: hypothetical protein ACWGQW_21540 [bacterium]